MTPAQLLCCAAALLGLAGAACSGEGAQGPPQGPPPEVIVAPVLQKSVPIQAEFIGQTAAAQAVEIRSQVDGTLERRAFEEGALVRKGQLLFAIDAAPYEAAVAQARAALEQARAALQKARDDVARYRPLAAQRAIPAEQLAQAGAQAKQAAANVAAARAQLDEAQLNLGYTRIAAPIDGRIGAALVQTGGLVLRASTLLDTVYGVDPVHVTFSPSERLYLDYRKRVTQRRAQAPGQGEPVQLSLADGSLYPLAGRIDMVDPSVDPATGTLGVRAEFANPDGLLRPGMFARIRLVVQELPDALLVPSAAIQQLQGTQSVFVVKPDGSVEARAISLGPAVGDAQVVSAGLAKGERVVVAGAQKLRPGIQVRAVVEVARAYSATAKRPER